MTQGTELAVMNRRKMLLWSSAQAPRKTMDLSAAMISPTIVSSSHRNRTKSDAHMTSSVTKMSRLMLLLLRLCWLPLPSNPSSKSSERPEKKNPKLLHSRVRAPLLFACSGDSSAMDGMLQWRIKTREKEQSCWAQAARDTCRQS